MFDIIKFDYLKYLPNYNALKCNAQLAAINNLFTNLTHLQ